MNLSKPDVILENQSIVVIKSDKSLTVAAVAIASLPREWNNRRLTDFQLSTITSSRSNRKFFRHLNIMLENTPSK